MPEVELAVDGRALFDQQPLHLLALRTGLVRHQLHAEDGLRRSSSASLERLHHLHAAALAAATGMNLRLHHDHRIARVKQAPWRPQSASSSVIRHLAAGNRHAVLPQNLFSLILVNFHRLSSETARARSVADAHNRPQSETRTMVRLSSSPHQSPTT